MKLERGKYRYKMPAHSGIEFACIETQDRARFSLMHINAESFLALDSTILGMPTMFMRLPDAIHFSPTPDAAYRAIVRYVPPVREI